MCRSCDARTSVGELEEASGEKLLYITGSVDTGIEDGRVLAAPCGLVGSMTCRTNRSPAPS